MSKLNQEELLEELRQIRIYVQAWKMLNPKKISWTSRREQAYQQIKEMIQGRAEQEEIEVRYIEIILDLYDRLEKKRPEVTEEIVGKCAMKLVSFIGYPKKARKGKIYSTMQVIREMFKEAGMEVVEE